jgi:CRP-like cAMP-binding protein
MSQSRVEKSLTRSGDEFTLRLIGLPRGSLGDALAGRSPNLFLSGLSAADFELLRPHLRTSKLPHKDVLARAGEALTRVYFPHSGVISVAVRLEEGDMIEAASVGRDSVFGSPAALDGRISLSDAVVVLPGAASTIDVATFGQAAGQSATLRTTIVRHEQALFAQAQQSAACNASHAVEARLARWLLRTHDLSGEDNLLLTQESLAEMLGVGRSSVSPTVAALQRAGLIRSSRGIIQIIDLDGLMKSACECYSIVRAQYDRLLHSD